MPNNWDVIDAKPAASSGSWDVIASDPHTPEPGSPEYYRQGAIANRDLVNGIPRNIAEDPDLQFDGAPPLTDPIYSQPHVAETPGVMSQLGSMLTGAIKQPSLVLPRLAGTLGQAGVAAVRDADLAGGVKRGSAGILAGLIHTGSDIVDTVQRPMRTLSEALVPTVIDRTTHQVDPVATAAARHALADPLGAQAAGQQALAVNREIGTDRQEAMAKLGPAPTLSEMLASPEALGRKGAQLLTQGAESVPLMAAAVATRNPELGSSLMSIGSGAQEYTDLRGQGVDRFAAAQGAAVNAMTEKAGEQFALERVMAPGAGIGSFLPAAAAEGGQEFVTQLGQGGAEDYALGKQTPIGQQIAAALDAGLIGAGMGGGAHGVSVGMDAVMGRPTAPPVAAPAGPLEAPPPAAIAPEVIAAGNESLRQPAQAAQPVAPAPAPVAEAPVAQAPSVEAPAQPEAPEPAKPRMTLAEVQSEQQRRAADRAGNDQGRADFDAVERAAPEAPDRLAELRDRRAAGEKLTPDETAEYADLSDADRVTARIAGNGVKMPGVQTMEAEGRRTAPVKGFLDLDNFKAVNDRIGHSAGDQVIGQLGELLASEFPDNAFHKGGDEFVVHGTDQASVQAGLDRVRDALASSQIEITGNDGTTVTLPGVGLSYGIADTLENADAGLAADKASRAEAGLRSERGPDRRIEPRGPDRRGSEVAEGASENPPAPPAEQPEKAVASEPTTSLKNEVRDQQRTDRGLDPVLKEARVSNRQAIDRALSDIESNPNIGAETVERINSGGNVSHADEAVLLAEDVRLRKQRNDAAERAADPAATDEARAVAKREWEEAEARIHDVDQAAKTIGTAGGRILQFRKRLIREDYSFESLERRERVREGRPLTAAESAKVREMADTIAAQQAKLDKLEAKVADTEIASEVQALYDRLAADLKTGAKKKRPVLETLKARAEKSRAALAAMEDVKSGRKQSGAVIDPRALVYLADIGAYHFANGLNTLAEWTAKMRAEIGRAFDAVLPDVFKSAKAINDATAKETAGATATVAEVVDGIEKDNLTHKDVYNLARAHVRAGVKGEGPVMVAVTKDLMDAGIEIDERTVRQLFSEYGKAAFPSKDADKAALRELRALVQLQESIDRIEEGLPKLKNGLQRDKATEDVRKKRARLNELLKAQEKSAAPDPAKVAAYQQARAENLAKQIEALDKQIFTGERPEKKATAPTNVEIERLKSLRDRLRSERKAIDKPPKSPDERYQQSRGTAIARQLRDVQARIAANDYERKPKPVPRELSAANAQAAFELDKAKEAFSRHQFEAEMAKRSPLKKIFGGARETLNLARAIMTSVDLSAVLRQGGFIAVGNPIRAGKAIGPMLHAFASEKADHAVMAEIKNRPNAQLYKRAGLELTEDSGYTLAKLEEAFMSRWIAKVPKVLGGGLLRGSQRAFTTFLNKLRADSFDAMIASLAKNGNAPTLDEAKAIASYINVATGRGKIGVGPNGAVGLNTVFFAPRLVASRFNLLAGQPLYGGTMRTRALVAAEYARFLAGIGVIIGLGALAHDPDDDDKPFISFDPRSADFMKMRFGKTYIDPLTGLAQVTTFLAREISGEKVTGKGDVVPLRREYKLSNLFSDHPNYDKLEFGQQTAFDVAAQFARTKLAPIPGAIVNTAAGEDVVGNPVTPASTVTSLVTPLSLQNVVEIMQEHGVAGGTSVELMNMLGMGVQYRDPAAMAAPDYNSMSTEEKGTYNSYVAAAGKTKAAKKQLQDFANSLPAGSSVADIREAVESKAEELGLSGATVDSYKFNTTAKDDDGRRKHGVQRTSTGSVKLDFGKATGYGGFSAAQKSVSKLDTDIDDIQTSDMSDEEISERLVKHGLPRVSGENAQSDALKMLRFERKNAQERFLGE